MNHSDMKKAPNSRDEPVFCLHTTHSLAKKPHQKWRRSAQRNDSECQSSAKNGGGCGMVCGCNSTSGFGDFAKLIEL